MTASPKVLIKPLDFYPSARCVEVDRDRSTGRREIRHPPSSNMKNNRRINIWKNLDERLKGTYHQLHLLRSPNGIAHESGPLIISNNENY